MTTTAQQHAEQFNHLFFDFITKATSLRDLSGKILTHAILAKALDLDGTIGTSCLNTFVVDYGAVRQANITAIRDYIIWVFTPGEIKCDDKGTPILDEGKSTLRWKGAHNRFEPATDEIEVEKDGNKIKKRVARKVDIHSVKTRLAAVDGWWVFNSAKPESAYKSNLLKDIKRDMDKMKEGKYIPTAEERAFLEMIAGMATERGLLK